MSRSEQIVREAEERLSDAKFGLEMMRAGQGRAKTGLRNVAVFGRMVTFTTNNLRSAVSGFEEWDLEQKARHLSSTECRYMYKLRNIIEKQAQTPTGMAVKVGMVSTEVISQFPKPPGASSFFIGDDQGGSGWIVKSESGDAKYYVDLPNEIAKVWITLPDFDLRGDAAEVAESYITSLENYLAEVREFVRASQA